ncbi:hypothetical protein ARAF_0422 [Arsenophonus endosymbiont of Aleurodicus floccissimus]|nr:terminase small subunit [Arsenophonus endosymbiont of Aleurodicus floccissimus]SPP31303.1 hypothetical protein ARAF_0422 [Arsenophonus endosymbiont of Aleurodicus floccissimus]
MHAGKNQREAAIDAGYSEKSVISKGSHLVKDKDVVKYLKMLIASMKINQPVDEKDNLSDEELKDSIRVMTLIMVSNITTVPKLALDAAAKLAPYVHRKLDDPGKKELKAERAQAVNRFTALPIPSFKH